jgi:4-amino-4-deoxy-L-arabinose transferase-like glycosyltransferase
MRRSADVSRSEVLPRVLVQPRAEILGAAAVLAAIVVGAIVRVWALGAVGFNSDEAVYAGQAAALAGNPDYAKFFAIFRAHPLLVQFLLSTVFSFGVSDVAARLLSVVVGLAAIPLIYLLGSALYSRRVGIVAAAVLAVLPYHVVVTRQVLLDGTETTLFLLTMLLIALYVQTSLARYLYAAAAAAGLTFLAKETAILVVPVAVAFALMTPTVRLGWRRIGLAVVIFVLAVSPYPISILISGASNTARSFLLWQLLRRPNHTFTFYAEILPGALGWVLLALVLVGIAVAIRRAGWQDRLLLAWVLVPLVFVQLWPVKGYQYLMPIVPALIILAVRAIPAIGRAIGRRLTHRRIGHRPALVFQVSTAVITAALLVSVAAPTLAGLGAGGASGSLAGTGGLPGGREAGRWIDQNVPQGAAFMTIGPTMSNIIQFYGHRRSQGLSVSPNPLHRNPAYDPIDNPDNTIRTLRIQYMAWDIWSASRSSHFEATLMRYVNKYHGKLIHEQEAEVTRADGSRGVETVIRIYEVRP